MTSENKAAIVTSAPLHIKYESASSAFDNLKAITIDSDTFERAIDEIHDYNSEFLDHMKKFKSIRIKLGLDEKADKNYITGSVFGYIAIVHEFISREETLPRIKQPHQDQYCLSLLRPTKTTDYDTSYYRLLKEFARTRDLSVTDAFSHLVFTSDKRYFSGMSQMWFGENSKRKLEEFKLEENGLTDIIQNRVSPDDDDSGNEGLYLGAMDAVMPFRTKRSDALIDFMLDGMEIDL